MTSADVMKCLQLRWPDEDHVHIPEAPEGPDRGGRKLDLLVVSLWRSRGLLLDGVEIKVSYADWKRERDNPEKADRWWSRVNRFWVAVPETLASRVLQELPPTWGLLSCTESPAPPIPVVKAAKRERDEMPWPMVVGLLRTASGAGRNALERARAQGREAGEREGIEAERRKRSGDALTLAGEELEARVREFEAASGLRISGRWDRMEELGRIVQMVHRERLEPGWLMGSLETAAATAERAAQRILENAKGARLLAGAIESASTPPEGSS